jgi:hypothetical protein
MLADYARAGGFVLTERHEQIAKKYGVSFDGVIVSRQIPTEDAVKAIVAKAPK